MVDKMDIASKLEEIGLTKKEAKVYLANLELGEATIQEISRKSGVKRTSIYNLVEDLVKRGVIETVARGEKRKFVAANPATLKRMVLRRTRAFEDAFPYLETLFSRAKFKPRVRFYEGVEGLKTVLNDTLLEKEPIKAFLDFEKGYKMLGGFIYSYIRDRVKLDITARVIGPANEISQDFKSRDGKSLRETRFIPEDKFPFENEVNIYGNKVSFMTHDEQRPIGVIIESPEIVKTMSSIFDLAWEYAGILGKKRKI